ncbi:hypothetical protein A5740_02810 [Mycobacterium sp. GA-1841]|nr:hypothetical protein A5740_02810 [Mycobacterium sp. GA-1841]
MANLRLHVQAAVDSLTDPAPYAPDADVEDNSHLEADPSVLLDQVLIHELAKGSSLPLASNEELKTKSLICHAVLIGNEKNRAIFVKKRSPIHLAKKSLVALLMNGTLDKVQSPIFAFDASYDAIITTEKVYILNKIAFEGLFKDSDAVLAQTHDWVDEVARSVPMVDGSADAIVAALKRNQFLRRKFFAVKERAHIKTITSEALKAEIERHGYDANMLMDGDKLRVTEGNVKLVLQLLNEDLFSGGFSQDRYAAGSKRAVR